MSRNRNLFTVYDMMEAKGIFEQNPANAGSRSADGQPLYRGPVEYPKMFYHPKGERRVLVPGTTEVTPWGPQRLGELTEIVWKIAENAEQAKALRTEGWHTHPAHSVSAGGGVAPAISPQSYINDLQARIAELEAEQSRARALECLPESDDVSQPLKPIARKA